MTGQTLRSEDDRTNPPSSRRTPQGQPAPHPARGATTHPHSPAMAHGDRVRWQDKAGFFRRNVGDGNAEVTIANRAYRVRIADLRLG
jgi:hypothetical protein